MLDLLRRLFSDDDFMPHAMCFAWRPTLVWLHASSDAIIGTAYVAISLTLYGLVRRIRLPFSPMILAFGLFIGACGLTHYLAVYTLWIPDYWLDGAVKVITAAASAATGAYLFQARPTIIRVTLGAQLAEERRLRLESTHRELEELYARVKDLDDAKTRFFANVSHELRTPLALVIGPVERLLGGTLPEAERRDLEVVRRNGRLLLARVNELLDIARLEEGKATLSYARVDLVRLARTTGEVFEAAARERRVALSLEAPDAVPAEVDPEKLSRILLNLLGNALRFSPAGSRIVCRIEDGGASARIEVDDQGPGVPVQERERIFERFRRGEGAARTEGSGLGLAIARELAALHGGTLSVGDAPGGGARFVLEVPLRAPRGAEVRDSPPELSVTPEVAADALAPLHEPSAAAGATPPARPDAPLALVAEDDAEMRAFLTGSLAEEFRVETAADGNEALEKAVALRPDVVVSDVGMPRVPGDRLVRELRRRPETGDTPVLLVTARAEDAVRLRALREGAADYLVKPVAAPELVARARNLAEMKRSRDALEAALAVRGGGLVEAARELGRRARELETVVDGARVAREQAERASHVKSVFLGMISHELRTPLTSLQLSLQALGRDRQRTLTAEQRESVRRMGSATTRLIGLVDSLLAYTRAESGRLEVRPEQFDLSALAAEVIDELRPQAQQKLLELGLAPLAAPLPAVVSDPRLVRIVLMNLTVNAVKFTERGSVQIALAAGPGGHEVAVHDTGPGIAPEDLPRVFEPFEQVDGAQRRSAGVGLGLSLVRSIVDALGGTIEARSSPQGSVFTVRLPPHASPASAST